MFVDLAVLIRRWILLVHLDTGVGKPLGSTRLGQPRGGPQRLVRPTRACSPFPWGDIGYFSMSVYGACCQARREVSSSL